VFLAGIIIVLMSPQKRSTLARMGAALAISLVFLIILGTLLKVRDPEAIGVLGGRVSLPIAPGAGLIHLLSLKRKDSA